MKNTPEEITEDMLRESGPVEKAMAKAFALEAPPMPAFLDSPQFPSYTRALADDELDELMAAGTEQLHLREITGKDE